MLFTLVTVNRSLNHAHTKPIVTNSVMCWDDFQTIRGNTVMLLRDKLKKHFGTALTTVSITLWKYTLFQVLLFLALTGQSGAAVCVCVCVCETSTSRTQPTAGSCAWNKETTSMPAFYFHLLFLHLYGFTETIIFVHSAGSCTHAACIPCCLCVSQTSCVRYCRRSFAATDFPGERRMQVAEATKTN